MDTLVLGFPLPSRSDMREYTVERPRHAAEIQGLHEQARVLDLPAAAGAQEPPQLLLVGPFLLRRLLLEGAERPEVALSVDDLFHSGGSEGADQLVLKIDDAHVEAERFHLGAGEVGAEARPLETAPEVALLPGVAEARQPDVQPSRSEPVQEASDGLRTPDRDDGDPLGAQIPTMALGQRFEGGLVAGPLDEHDRGRLESSHTSAL
jgi:hypothetical protein